MTTEHPAEVRETAQGAGAPVVLSEPADAPDLAERLRAGLADARPAAVLLFASPGADLPALAAHLGPALGTRVVGCSSAGEFACGGYGHGHVVAVGLPAARFRTEAVWLRNLAGLGVSEWMAELRALFSRFEVQPRRHRFGLLLIDGLSRQGGAGGGDRRCGGPPPAGAGRIGGRRAALRGDLPRPRRREPPRQRDLRAVRDGFRAGAGDLRPFHPPRGAGWW